MKNRKKPLIKEKRSLVITKLSKAFTLISANRFDIIKRAFGIAFTLVLACSLVLPFVGNNKAQALSNPTTDSINTSNLYTGAYHNWILTTSNVNDTINVNDTYQYNKGEQSYTQYMSYGGAPNRYISTCIDQTRTVGSNNIYNYYYDGTAQNSNNYIRQGYTSNTNSLNLTTFRSNYIEIYVPEPTLIYDLQVALINARFWYYPPVGKMINPNDTSNLFSSAPNPYGFRSTNELSVLKVTLEYSFNDINNVNQSFSYSFYTNKYSLDSSNALKFTGEAIEKIFEAPFSNNCSIVNSIKITMATFQRPTLASLQPYMYSYDPNGSNSYNYIKSQNKIEELYNQPLYSALYMELPFYNENMSETLKITQRARDLWYKKIFSETLTINDFWLSFINFEIIPNFKLSYFVIMSLGLILVIVFVRMFR